MAASQILRFTGAAACDPAVRTWFAERTGELGAIAQRWFAQMRGCGTDVLELLHDGCPVALVEDAPFGYVNVFTAHVNVGFFHGALLRDPTRILAGSGKRMRHVKLTTRNEDQDAGLSALIEAAYQDILVRLRAAPDA